MSGKMKSLSCVLQLGAAAIHYLNNARQITKLPDYAVVDTTTPPNDRYPGKIVLAGFFNEDWGM